MARPNRPSTLMPLSQKLSLEDSQYHISKHEKYLLKFMNKQHIILLFDSIDNLKHINFETITNKNIRNTLESNPLILSLYDIIYTNNSRDFNITYDVVKVNDIIFLDGTRQTFDDLYFYKSKGVSRSDVLHPELSTKDYWFPTDKCPFQLDLNGNLDRISKLEDNILGDHSNYNLYNITKYGRFLTEENALISKYLFNLNLN